MKAAERRLAAIMFTDMIGYSALAQRNEALALDLLAEHQRGGRSFAFKGRNEDVRTIGTRLNLGKVDPELDPLRSDPRFVELLKKVGLTP